MAKLFEWLAQNLENLMFGLNISGINHWQTLFKTDCENIIKK